jgi:hypothetical protein
VTELDLRQHFIVFRPNLKLGKKINITDKCQNKQKMCCIWEHQGEDWSTTLASG